MEEKIKAYCEEELNNAKRWNKMGFDTRSCLTRAYGATMFYLNYVLNEYDQNFANWWEDEMLPKFLKIS